MNLTIFLFAALCFQVAPSMEHTYDGGALNPGSTMNLLWTMSHDVKLGARLEGWQGVTIRVADDGETCHYRLEYKVKALKEVKAFQITAVVFDVFRTFRENWRVGRVVDLKEGEVAEGFFEKEVSRDEARLLGGSFLYLSSVVNANGSPLGFAIDPVFNALKGIIPGFRSSWIKL